MGTDEGGQAGDGWMTWVKSGGHDWRNICRRTQETMTAAHEELSPNGNLRMDYICVLDQLHYFTFIYLEFCCTSALYSKVLEQSLTSPRELHFINIITSTYCD